MLRRKGATGTTGTTFTCGCSSSGGCRVEIDGGEASCMESGCSGTCKWSVNVPGLVGMKITATVLKAPVGPTIG
jgi:hypothetical protein